MVNDIFNVKIYQYPNSTQVRIYKKPIICKDKIEIDEKTGEIYYKEKKIEKGHNIYIDNPFTNKEELVSIEDENELLEQKEKRSQYVSKNRTKQQVYYLARSNVWDMFVTFTLDNSVDRYDYNKCTYKLRHWLNNIKNRYCSNIKYLIVPEKHKDGAWHFHGLISNIPNDFLHYSGVIDNNNNKVYNLLYSGRGSNIVYDNGAWLHGYNTVTLVQNTDAVSKYICKYITKSNDCIDKGKRKYFASSGLKNGKVTTCMVDKTKTDNIFQMIDDNILFCETKETLYNTVTYVELDKDYDIRKLEKYLSDYI